MQLLYIDRDRESARQLHSEFLNYRGLNWSLVHCADYQQAIQRLDHDTFQTVLYRMSEVIDVALVELTALLNTDGCPPVLTVGDQINNHNQLRLIELGCDDIANGQHGAAIMRLLRMAEMRSAKWLHQSEELLDDVDQMVDWLAESDGATGADCLTSDATSRKLLVAHVVHGNPLLKPNQSSKSSDAYQFQLIDAAEVVQQLKNSSHAFDAILVEQSAFEATSQDVIRRLSRHLKLLPSVILTREKSDFAALSYVERGYGDCLVADECSWGTVQLAIRKSFVRRRRAITESISRQEVGEQVNDRRSTSREGSNRRRHARFFFERDIVAIPVLPGGAPDRDGQCDATAVDVSLGGVGIKMSDRQQLPSRNWVVGIPQANGKTGYISSYMRRVSYNDGTMQLGLVFQNATDDLFAAAKLMPRIDQDSGQFAAAISNTALEQWRDLGVLQRRLIRRARDCPECEAVCTVGTGCGQCGSFDLQFADLIHHFACAHMDEATAFEQPDGDIRCAKCLQDQLVAGADFEIIRSHFECHECNYEGDVTAEVGCCLNCELKFPLALGIETDVYGYHVERLDVLALVDSAR